MKSVDALRKWADGLRCVWIDPNDHSIIVTTCDDMPPSIDCVNLREHVNAILDGIEREVADMVPLPVDADGVPIHVGDVMDWNGDVEPIRSIHVYGDEVYAQSKSFCWPTTQCRHHHAPTVEDVLREFVDAWAEWKDGAAMMNPVETFAAKLRLVGDE